MADTKAIQGGRRRCLRELQSTDVIEHNATKGSPLHADLRLHIRDLIPTMRPELGSRRLFTEVHVDIAARSGASRLRLNTPESNSFSRQREIFGLPSDI